MCFKAQWCKPRSHTFPLRSSTRSVSSPPFSSLAQLRGGGIAFSPYPRGGGERLRRIRLLLSFSLRTSSLLCHLRRVFLFFFFFCGCPPPSSFSSSPCTPASTHPSSPSSLRPFPLCVAKQREKKTSARCLHTNLRAEAAHTYRATIRNRPPLAHLRLKHVHSQRALFYLTPTPSAESLWCGQ